MMKKLLILLLIGALVAQICARPGDKADPEKKATDAAKDVAKDAKDDGKKAKDAVEGAGKKAKKDAEDVAKDVTDPSDDDDCEPKKPKTPKHPHKPHSGPLSGLVKTSEKLIDSGCDMVAGFFGGFGF